MRGRQQACCLATTVLVPRSARRVGPIRASSCFGKTMESSQQVTPFVKGLHLQCSPRVHAPINSVMYERIRVEICQLDPVRQCVGSTIDTNDVVISFVIALLLKCRPSNVTRFVIPVIIDTIQRMLGRWTLAHVIQERSENPPASTNLDAAPTILMIIRRSLVGASLNHPRPDAILGCAIQPMSKIGFRSPLTRPCSLEAPARFGFSASEVNTKHNRVVPAIASTMPVATKPRRMSRAHYPKKRESLIRQIDNFAHASQLAFRNDDAMSCFTRYSPCLELDRPSSAARAAKALMIAGVV